MSIRRVLGLFDESWVYSPSFGFQATAVADSQTSFIVRADGGKPIKAIQLSAIGGAAKNTILKVYPMRSIWKK